TQVAVFASGVGVEPGVTVRIGNGFTQFVGHDVGHGVRAFIGVGGKALRRARRTGPVGALRGGGAHEGDLEVRVIESAVGVISAVVSAEFAFSNVGGRQNEKKFVFFRREGAVVCGGEK